MLNEFSIVSRKSEESLIKKFSPKRIFQRVAAVFRRPKFIANLNI